MSVEFTESKTPGAASRDTATHTQAGRANNRTRDENTITDRKSHDHEQPRLRDTEYNRPPECQKRPLRNAQAHNPIRRHRYARGRPGHARPGANPRRLRRGRPRRTQPCPPSCPQAPSCTQCAMTTLWFKNTSGDPGVSRDTYAGGVATQSSTGTVALKSHKSHKSGMSSNAPFGRWLRARVRVGLTGALTARPCPPAPSRRE